MLTPTRVPVGLAVLAVGVAAGQGVPAQASFPGENGKIAFHSNRTGNFEIYTANPDGSGLAQLTFTTASNRGPNWSPDGTTIAFYSTRDTGKFFNLYTMNADGSNQTRLAAADANDFLPAYSPDGTKIAFTSDRETGYLETWIMNSDGTGIQRLTFSPATPADRAVLNCCSGAPDWSPDGSRIAFGGIRDGKWDIFSMNPDVSDIVRLTDEPPGCVMSTCSRHPSWSPDGEQIAFESTRDAGAFQIYVMEADGSDQKRVTDLPAVACPGLLCWNFHAAWSPDGDKIAFNSTRDGNIEVYVMKADGSDQINITNNPANDGFPRWQSLPDDSTENDRR